MNEIGKLVCREIEQHQLISFARFMELALYCPKIGYYEQNPTRVGRLGDYYTSCSVGSLFGELLGYQIAEWLAQLPGPVQCVEAGAHDGQLALDILNWLSQNRAELLTRMQYWVMEPSFARKQWQQRKLDKFAGQVYWADSFAQLPAAGVHGVIFSNELLDAMPVHQLRWDAEVQMWCEWGVGIENGKLTWKKMEPGDWAAELHDAGLDLPPELMHVLPGGFTIEYSTAANEWWRAAAQSLRSGRLITIDYGLTSEERMNPRYAQGTLRTYSQHQVGNNPLAAPGEQDITAHVNFTQLQLAGESAGLRTEGLLPQRVFLTKIAQKNWTTWDAARTRQFQTLTHPDFLGQSFRVLAQIR